MPIKRAPPLLSRGGEAFSAAWQSIGLRSLSLKCLFKSNRSAATNLARKAILRNVRLCSFLQVGAFGDGQFFDVLLIDLKFFQFSKRQNVTHSFSCHCGTSWFGLLGAPSLSIPDRQPAHYATANRVAEWMFPVLVV